MDGPDPVNARLRQLPAVDLLVEASSSGVSSPRWALLAAARAVLDEVRAELLGAPDGPGTVDLEPLATRVRTRATALCRPWPRRVLNATGVVLHTNLGRAPLSAEAAAAVAEAAVGYSDLELDLDTGRRGSRLGVVRELLCRATGAEDALVVNNNAAAVLLALDALAPDRDVLLSRGELVEIGGSFRVPEILGQSRARLVEVGTTNRTHLRDYRDAIGPNAGALLKVHRSNFEIRGFTHDTGLRELAPLAREHGLPLIEDRGSGTIVDLSEYGIPEPEVQRGLADGADLVLFSGDKLLGGPQAGIALGSHELIERMRTSQLARALRVDKMTLAALDVTLRTLLEGRLESLPVLGMLLATPADLEARAERLAKTLATRGFSCSVVPQGSLVGGGALPDFELPGFVVRVESPRSPAALARALRAGDPPLLVRVSQGALLLDPRTLTDDDARLVGEAFKVGAIDQST
ncbi:MAG: L-seryl-tRNA(Sec) selenium transferase [Deltaproteobacteria bacterium]|nr:L-seryl-tRNA(Sec) selenium transferase [Deltaproteobacteria bacterium]MBW2413588.1 L-seryl-tRNA(Sec) selenium transferase [Deltaproteobacteria bacterium]